MHLKKLELIGFKSFVDKTELVFEKGFTGVVGPNGCGKSNVVDAFKWILGEQSAKGLRGSEMKDVIFNGTQARKPAGFAEVTVTFDNDDRFFDLDFSEVAFTRRLFRSGESEYLINGQRCRLRDIKNLLMDTGIGASSYSIFEQGKIDVLLQANPHDRRIIFEEAAGISKYRARKAESLRALQRVEDNLARLGDVISELEKRERRVKSQASKARRYREYTERLRDLRIRLAIDEYTHSMTDRAELTFERHLLDLQIERIERLVGRLRRGLEIQSQERARKSEGLRELRSQLGAIRSRRERLEESITHNRRRLDEFRLEMNRQGDLRVETSRSIEESRASLESERKEVETLAVEVEQRRETLAREEAALAALRQEHQELREELDRRKQELVHCLREHSTHRNQEVQIEAELSSLAARAERLEAQLSTATGELDELTRKEAGLGEELRLREEEKESLELERQDRLDRRLALEQEQEASRERLNELGAEDRGLSSRLELLEHLEESLEGVSQGVVEILESATERPGVHDILARLIQVDRPAATALEAILGPRAQALVLEDEEGALRLLDEARDRGAGALEVLPLDRVAAPRLATLEPVPGMLGHLRDFVRCPSAYAGLLDRLLEGIILVEDFQAAIDLTRNGAAGLRIVTRTGEVLEPSGSLAIPGEISTGLISRRSEIEELEARRQALSGLLEAERTRTDELATTGLALEEEIESLSLRREELSSGVVTLRGQVEQLEVDRGRLARSVEVTRSELDEIGETRSGRERELEELREKVRELGESGEALGQGVEDLETRIQEHGQELQAGAERVTTARVELTEGLKREEDLRRGLAQIERSLSEKERRLESTEEQLEELAERLEQTTEELERAESTIVEVRQEQESLEEQATVEEERDRELGEIEAEFRAEIDRLAETKSSKVTERGEINLRDQEGVLKRGQVLDRISREYDLDLVETVERLSLPETGSTSGSAGAAESEEAVETPGETEGEGLLEAIASQETESTESGEPAVDPGNALEATTPADAETAHAEAPGEENSAALQPVPDGEGALATVETADAPEAEDDSFEGRLRRFIRGEEPWDREEAEAEARDLDGRVRKLGNVNLDALDELDEIVERLSFQLEQRADLQKAERDLLRIIEEINKTCRERFEQTFDEVQKNFRELFVKCFGGGKAELVIEEDSDPLEGGIDIVARPPGKKLTSLSLMSGGEKTMTTIALMFAIFRARPSPFCILDEVDAPLDEANVRRFVVLVQDFLGQSQFIVITHNKITMAVADRLYGVTMQEKGVSKPVSVEFEKYDPADPAASMSTADLDRAPEREAAAPVAED